MVTTWLVGPLGNVDRLRRSIARRLVLRLLSRARWFVPQTADSARELIELGLPADRVVVQGGGVDLRRFRPAHEPRATGPASRAAIGTWPSMPVDSIYARSASICCSTPGKRRRWTGGSCSCWAPGTMNWTCVARADQAGERARARLAGRRGSAARLGRPVPASHGCRDERPGDARRDGLRASRHRLGDRRPVGPAPRRRAACRNQLAAWVQALQEIDALGAEGRHAAGRRARAWAEAHADSTTSHARWAGLLSSSSAGRELRAR